MVDEGGTSVRVATAADPAEFERLFLEVFAGEAIAVVVLTPTERGYIGQIAATMAALDASLGEVFGDQESQVEQAPADEVMREFAEVLFGGLVAVQEVLTTTAPPAEYQAPHDDFVDVVGQLLSAEAAFVAWIDENVSSDPIGDLFWEMLEQAAEDAGITSLFDEFDEACGRLELVALARGASTEICVNG